MLTDVHRPCQKIERMTMISTTKTALHDHAKKLLLTCMANVFPYHAPSRKQYHENLVPKPQLHQLFTPTSNVAFCISHTYGYRTLAKPIAEIGSYHNNKRVVKYE